jgi:hypothetical protein
VVRLGQALGWMRPTVVQEAERQALRKGLRQGSDGDLAHVGVQVWQREEAVLACGRLDRAIDREALEDRLDRPHGRHPPGGEPPPADGQYTAAAVVRAEDADGAGVGGRDRRLQAARTTRLKG